jgi:hypothetical protein
MVIVPGLSIGAEVADPELFQDAVRACRAKRATLSFIPGGIARISTQ